MPRKTYLKGHIVNFTYELKLFLVLSNIHMSQMNKEKELESNPGVLTFSTKFSTPFLWNFLPGEVYYWQSQENANIPCMWGFASHLNTILLLINPKMFG